MHRDVRVLDRLGRPSRGCRSDAERVTVAPGEPRTACCLECVQPGVAEVLSVRGFRDRLVDTASGTLVSTFWGLRQASAGLSQFRGCGTVTKCDADAREQDQGLRKRIRCGQDDDCPDIGPVLLWYC